MFLHGERIEFQSADPKCVGWKSGTVDRMLAKEHSVRIRTGPGVFIIRPVAMVRRAS